MGPVRCDRVWMRLHMRGAAMHCGQSHPVTRRARWGFCRPMLPLTGTLALAIVAGPAG